jgi:hypothetical protein
MDGYLVFKGNEFGLYIDNEQEFIPLHEAEKLYEQYKDEYDTVAMYQFTGYSILLVKSHDPGYPG